MDFSQYENISLTTFLVGCVIVLARQYLKEKEFSRTLAQQVIKLATLWEEKADSLSATNTKTNEDIKKSLDNVITKLDELRRKLD